jgi:hypothetical protein
MYLRIINNEIQYPYSIENLKMDNKNVTFPLELTENDLLSWDMYEVRQTPKPNNYTKIVSEETPMLIEGVYYQNWVITDASQELINTRLETKWNEVRDIRNQLLLECDWTQLSDIPTEIKSVWTEYRQNLRDISNQIDPFNIEWPIKP